MTQSHWYAFPSSRKAKVWIEETDKVRHALDLYHPYSGRGRAITWLFRSMPNVASRFVLRTRADPVLSQRLGSFAKIIRDRLGIEDLAVSFSLGTPGGHQKLTARASQEGRAVAYVKISENAAVTGLLRNEARMLNWLDGCNLRSAVLPKCLGTAECSNSSLIFLGPPPGRARQRSAKVSSSEVEFLEELNSLNSESIAPEEFFADWEMDTIASPRDTETTKCAELLARCTDVARTSLVQSGVRVGAGHGDFAPWNTLDLEDGRLFVFDWEYGSKQSVALADVFHRLIMPARLLEGLPARKIVDRIFALLDQQTWQRLFRKHEISHENLAAHLLIYLMISAIQKNCEGENIDAFTIDCLRIILEKTNSKYF